MDKYNDYELVALAQENNEDAFNILYKKYKPIIFQKSSCVLSFANHHGIDINDVMQEAYLAFDNAIRNFSEYNNTSFYTFAIMCVDRHLKSYLKRIRISKNKILNEAITISEVLEKTIKSNTDVENDFILSDSYKDVILKCSSVLTDFELEVLKLKIDGYSFENIADMLNKDTKSIYNCFYRSKLKIQKFVNKDS